MILEPQPSHKERVSNGWFPLANTGSHKWVPMCWVLCSNVYTYMYEYPLHHSILGCTELHSMFFVNKISIKMMFECRFVGGPIHDEPTLARVFSLHIVTTIVHAKRLPYTLLRFDIN